MKVPCIRKDGTLVYLEKHIAENANFMRKYEIRMQKTYAPPAPEPEPEKEFLSNDEPLQLKEGESITVSAPEKVAKPRTPSPKKTRKPRAKK